MSDPTPPRLTADFVMDEYRDHNRFLIDEVRRLNAENSALRQWKAEALVVLSEWDDVWKAAGCPGPLGGKKAKAVNDHVEAILTDADLQRESFMAADARARRAEAQVERDRRIILLAEELHDRQPGGDWYREALRDLHDEIILRRACAPDEANVQGASKPAETASTPDEVNPDDVSLESLFPQELIDELGACAPDEVNEAQRCVCGHSRSEHFRDAHACMYETTQETWACACEAFRAASGAPDEVNEGDPDGYRLARGVVHLDEPAETIIRRSRGEDT